MRSLGALIYKRFPWWYATGLETTVLYWLKNRFYTGNQQTLAPDFLKITKVINAFFVINQEVLVALSGEIEFNNEQTLIFLQNKGSWGWKE